METAARADRIQAQSGYRVERRSFSLQDPLARRVAAEYEEMPGLRLTLAQASRLFRLRTDVCVRTLDDLVRDGILRRDESGSYALDSSRP